MRSTNAWYLLTYLLVVVHPVGVMPGALPTNDPDPDPFAGPQVRILPPA